MEYQTMVDGIEIQSNEQVNGEEARAHISYIRKNNPRKETSSVELSFNGEEVGSGYHLQPEGFEKVRRIADHLVGTVDRFNSGKRAEEHDRAKRAQTAERCFFPV